MVVSVLDIIRLSKCQLCLQTAASMCKLCVQKHPLFFLFLLVKKIAIYIIGLHACTHMAGYYTINKDIFVDCGSFEY